MGPYFVSAYEQNLFNTRYADGPEEENTSWEVVFKRVVDTVADDLDVSPSDHAEWLVGMELGIIIPGSPQLWNYGSKTKRFPRNGSSCFTGKMGDTLESFRQADADAETVYVASGGFGLLLDEVRPRGCLIKHCSEGAMGSMCFGGPARRVEGTTGYITGSGRARGALMMQMGDRHPDFIEFVLSKRVSALGWLDDWPANAIACGGDPMFVHAFSTIFVHRKDWPHIREVEDRLGADGLAAAVSAGIARVDHLSRLIPLVTDFGSKDMERREANRDWDLPMQNCNMSVRLSDAFMSAAINDEPWAFVWRSKELARNDETPWTKHDIGGELRSEYGVVPVENNGSVSLEESTTGSRYSVVITTWSGLLKNMSPNSNHWRDTDYARFFRKIVKPAVDRIVEKAGHDRIMAAQLERLIAENAHHHADPGAVFSDTYERFQPVDSNRFGPRLSNPCSEYVNSAGGSCNLISVNLRACLPKKRVGYDGEATLDDLRNEPMLLVFLDEVRAAARLAIDYISHAMEHNRAPVEYIDQMTSEVFRTVGVGIMGLFEAGAFFHLKYGSELHTEFCGTVMSSIALECWDHSFYLAKKNPDTFRKPLGWCPERQMDIFRRRADNTAVHVLPFLASAHRSRWMDLQRLIEGGQHATHTCVTSVAPTGTISMIAGWQMTRESIAKGAPRAVSVTSGVEPPMSWGIKRQDSSGHDSYYHDMWFDDEHHEKPWMVTAMDGLNYGDHIDVQAAVCAFTCMSVSKTVNLPENSTVEDVIDALRETWMAEIPGTSLYRDKSKPMQVLTALECPSGECSVKLPWSDAEDAAK